ncbi:MAG: hypothetical protein P8Y09_07295, partial [Deltaproteobacteria bacterium]
MDFQNIVLPYNQSLIDTLVNRQADLIVRINDVSEIVPAADDIISSGNHIHSIILRTDKTLDTIEFSEEWETIPATLFSPGLGVFRELQHKFDLIHNLNVRYFFPADSKEAMLGLQTLSATGFECGVDFEVEKPDWEALIDLMTYSILMTTAHANVEPFSYLAENYDPHEFNDWGSVYFEDPNDYLHLDSAGRVALTSADLKNEVFIAENVSEVDKMDECPRLEEINTGWRRYFLEN